MLGLRELDDHLSCFVLAHHEVHRSHSKLERPALRSTPDDP
jgi:hypothetical protein